MDDKQLRFSRLSWIILECKYYYYEQSYSIIEDCIYDKLEMEYVKLAEELKLEPTAYTMVGFDSSRPSCKLVMGKLKNAKRSKVKHSILKEVE